MNNVPLYEIQTLPQPLHLSRRSRRMRIPLGIVSVVATVAVIAVIGSGIALHPAVGSGTADPSSNRTNLTGQIRRTFDTTPVATPAPTVVALLAPTMPPAPATAQPAILMTVEQVQKAETTLHTGNFVVDTQYTNGPRTTMDVGFVLGDAQTPPQLHVITTYSGALNTQTLELIAIGQQAWQRPLNGAWTPKTGAVDVSAQVLPFLPHVENRTPVIDRSVLRWYDTETNTDVVLAVDPGTGVPQQLERVARMGAPISTVHYRGWNTPVSITAPEGT